MSTITQFMVKSRFLQVVCPRCRYNQIVYGKSSIEVKCVNCNKLLTKSRGGKAKIKARIKQIWN